MATLSKLGDEISNVIDFTNKPPIYWDVNT